MKKTVQEYIDETPTWSDGKLRRIEKYILNKALCETDKPYRKAKPLQQAPPYRTA